jgi:hypothetical protein
MEPVYERMEEEKKKKPSRKRPTLEEAAPIFEGRSDFNAEECAGILPINDNARIVRSQISLPELAELEPDDSMLLANIISYASYQIARQHQVVTVEIATREEECRELEYGKIRVREYMVRCEMPKEVKLDKDGVTGLLTLHPRLITNYIYGQCPKTGNMILTVHVVSHMNRWKPDTVNIIQTVVNVSRVYNYEPNEANDSGSLKRARRG